MIKVLKSDIFYLFELDSFQDAVKIASVVQFGQENVSIVITTLLSESWHFIQQLLSPLSKLRSRAFPKHKFFENPAKIRHIDLKYAKGLKLETSLVATASNNFNSLAAWSW